MWPQHDTLAQYAVAQRHTGLCVCILVVCLPWPFASWLYASWLCASWLYVSSPLTGSAAVELCEHRRENFSLDDFFYEETFKTLGVETPLRRARL